MQAGEEGRGEEPEAAHEGPLPQAVLPPPSRRHARFPPRRRSGGGRGVQSQQQGLGDAAGSAGLRGGVHQAAQGADRGAQAAEGGPLQRRRRRRGHGVVGGRVRRRRRAHAGDRGAVPGRDVGRGAHQRVRPPLQAARGDHGAGAGGRRGGQRQLLRHRGQDLLHHPLAGAQRQDRARRRPGLTEAARPPTACTSLSYLRLMRAEPLWLTPAGPMHCIARWSRPQWLKPPRCVVLQPQQHLISHHAEV